MGVYICTRAYPLSYCINWNERAIEVAEGRIISVLRIEHERDVAKREIAEFDASPPHEVILSVIFRGAIREQSR